MSTQLLPLELPDAASFRVRLLGLSLTTTLLTVVVGSILFFYGLDLTPRQVRLGPWLIVGPALAVDIVVTLVAAHRLGRPVASCLEHGVDPEHPATTDGLVRALNLPALSTLRVALIQAPAFAVVMGLMILAVDEWLALSFSAHQVVLAVLTVALLGSGHAIVEYFVVASAVRPLVRGLQASGVTIDEDARRRVIEVGMRRKFLLVLAFATLVPMVVLGSTVLLKVESLMAGAGLPDASLRTAPLRTWVILLVAVTGGAIVYMSVVLAKEVMMSTEVLVQAMQRVKKNELDTKLAVTTTDEFAVVYEGFNSMTSGLQERQRLHDAFGRYVAPELADAVMREGVKLGGERVEASVLFADIRGFTSLAERITPEEVVDLLNRYFAAVEPAILSEGGWINKFGGDSLLAVFGAPVPHKRHAARAARAAGAIRKALDAFNAEQRHEGRPELQIGIGIAAGTLVAGNVGSPNRMEYTVIGDVVNTAARLEALTKDLNRPVLVSSAVVEALGRAFETEQLPPTRVPGKNEPLAVWALAENEGGTLR